MDSESFMTCESTNTPSNCLQIATSHSLSANDPNELPLRQIYLILDPLQTCMQRVSELPLACSHLLSVPLALKLYHTAR